MPGAAVSCKQPAKFAASLSQKGRFYAYKGAQINITCIFGGGERKIILQMLGRAQTMRYICGVEMVVSSILSLFLL